MSRTKLKKAPLKEVIFELHWEGTADASGMLRDNGFDLAQGKFSEKIKDEFPVHKRVVPENINIPLWGIPIHQYWKGEFTWPVIQHGQGLISVNDIEANYIWETSYKPTVLKAIKHLFDSYDNKLKINQIKLQYIDAWEIDVHDPIAFIEKNIRTSVQSDYVPPGKPANFNIIRNFEMKDKSELQLTLSTGKNIQNQKSSVILIITVEMRGNMLNDEVINWLEKAHFTASETFVNILNPDFYASLDR